MIDVVIIGAGISGLAAAIELQRAGLSVAVLESEAVAGGKIRTDQHGPYLIESGPHSFLGSSRAVWQLLANTGLLGAVQPATPRARNRFIYRDGRIHPLPLSPVAFVTSGLLSPAAKLRLAAEPFIRGAASTQDSVHQFVTRRLGKEVADYVAGPFVSGIYAGDPHQLGAYDSFPALWALERESGSLMRGALAKVFKKKSSNGVPRRRGLFSFTGGLGSLMDALASRLGAALSLSCPVDGIHREGNMWRVRDYKARSVIVAAPPRQAASMLGGAAAAALSQIALAPVAVVHVGCRQDGDSLPSGFGCLIPRNYGLRTLGTVFVSQIFAGRAPAAGALVASYIGGSLDPGALDLSDEQLIDVALSDFKQVTGVQISPDFQHVRRHRQAIPQLEVGHRARVGQIQKLMDEMPGVFLAGNYLSGVGMNDAVASGMTAAERAAEYLNSK